MKCSVFIAVSTDGLIAKPNGDIDWLHRPEYASADGGDFGFGAFIDSIDALVMGRNTFEKVIEFKPWPYEGTKVIVLTSRNLHIPDELISKVCIESGTPAEITNRLSQQGLEHLYIDGGATIQQFLNEHLINEITLTHIPILLGDGISLFGSFGSEIQLELIEAKSENNGFVITKYRAI